ncbi:MAG: flagellar hook-basal body complex protein FliE [Fimbriimonadales bacterium]|jgi:flagellar hook-basal body complex protein FliE|nr:flagellar hook-basal body complex protein FliE [Fimbriimonadales bacterium]
MRINNVTSLQPETLVSTPKPQSANGDNFGSLLMDALKEVNASQLNAREMQTNFMAGRNVELHDLQIALERASVAMQLTMQVRNKLLEAYQEIQRMQI